MQQMRLLVADDKIQWVLYALQNVLGAQPFAWIFYKLYALYFGYPFRLSAFNTFLDSFLAKGHCLNRKAVKIYI